MRVIEKEMLKAIREGRNWRSDNTEVRVDAAANGLWKRIEVFLHGNRIASFLPIEGKEAVSIQLFDGGYRSLTTKSRLRAIAEDYHGPNIAQKKGRWTYTFLGEYTYSWPDSGTISWAYHI